MIRSRFALMVLAAFAVSGGAQASLLGVSSQGEYFVDPDAWAVDDANTTYQQWDNLSDLTGNAPDVGTNNVGSPILTGFSPAFRSASTQNLYSFGGDYSIEAGITNNTPVGDTTGLGTHVIIQVSSTTNAGSEEEPNLIDSYGNLTFWDGTTQLTANAISSHKLFEGVVGTFIGPALLRQDIKEYYLPNYVGDFTIKADVTVHVSFDELRVDTAVASQAFEATEVTFVPEPTSLALLSLGGLLLTRRRRSA